MPASFFPATPDSTRTAPGTLIECKSPANHRLAEPITENRAAICSNIGRNPQFLLPILEKTERNPLLSRSGFRTCL
jgi:hypothetical protein